MYFIDFSSSLASSFFDNFGLCFSADMCDLDIACPDATEPIYLIFVKGYMFTDLKGLSIESSPIFLSLSY